jgi:hypothetical protein
MSPILAAVLALIAPHRRGGEPDNRAARLDVGRLSPHLRRDLGLADGRDRPDRGERREP